MALAAAQVVDALAARMTGLPLTGSRVYTSRLWAVSEAELPAWRLTAEDESIEAQMADGTNQHLLTVQCEGLVRATADVDDSMHALAAQGLTALCAVPALHGTQLTSIERVTTSEGEAAVGAVRIRVVTRFFVHPAAPETIV
jgi:hypothetical protein